jgi:hypothetical protein
VIVLADFDPQIVAEYHITEQTLEQVIHYVHLLQGEDAPTLQDIVVGGYYGTSALLHEVVELDILLERDPKLLEMGQDEALAFFHAHEDVHAQALSAEYTYLQRVIGQVFGQRISIGALVVANALWDDFYILAESGIALPLFMPEDEEITRASALLDELRSLGKGVKE